MNNSNTTIYQRVKTFAVKIVKFCHLLDQSPGARRTLSNQLLRAGTSIGANCYEAKYAESTSDFIHKLRISRKECSEVIFWLEVLIDSGIVDPNPLKELLLEAEGIGKTLTAIIKTKSSNQ